MKNKYISPLLALLIVLSIFVTGCSDDDDKVVSGETELLSFKILNAGVDNNISVEGIINNADKTVEVRVPFETNLSALKFEAAVSEGARIAPDNLSVQDFTTERNFAVVSGLNNSIYKISILKSTPTVPTLMNIRLVNGSATYYSSIIDYKKNTVSVQMLSGYTTKVKVETIEVGPSGATYNISNIGGDGFFDLSTNPTLTVSLGGQSTEYKIEINIVPVGADFSKPTNVELTAFKGAVPSVLGGGNNRDGHMANGIMYIPSRQGGNHVYYWENSKLFAGSYDPSELNLTGMDFTNVAWGLSSVYAVGDRVYVASMVNAKDQKLKVWCWANKNATPVQILEYTITDPVGGALNVRLGDAFSVAVDGSGNGKMFFCNFPFGNPNNQFYVFDVENYTQVNASPQVISLDLQGGNVGQYGRVNGIPGESGKYIVTGAEMGIALIDATGTIEHMVSTDVIQGRAQDARIVSFNDARYLVYTVSREWEAGGVFNEVINISEGENALEALKLLTPASITSRKMSTLKIGNPALADAWVSATSSAEVLNNQLYIMQFSTLSGFAIQRFDKNQ